MQNTPFSAGPLALTNTYTTNIMNPATITGGVNGGSGNLYLLITHIRIINITAGAITFRLYKGLTGANTAGTEVVGKDTSIAANSSLDYYGRWLFKAADFLVGGASASTSLGILIEGEIGVEM